METDLRLDPIRSLGTAGLLFGEFGVPAAVPRTASAIAAVKTFEPTGSFTQASTQVDSVEFTTDQSSKPRSIPNAREAALAQPARGPVDLAPMP